MSSYLDLLFFLAVFFFSFTFDLEIIIDSQEVAKIVERFPSLVASYISIITLLKQEIDIWLSSLGF